MVRPETFDKIRRLKDLSKNTELSWVESTNGTIGQMKKWQWFHVIFAILPLLINISEDVDLTYEINHLNNVDGEYLRELSSTIKRLQKVKKMHRKFLKISILCLF